jgi:hypothetical protein
VVLQVAENPEHKLVTFAPGDADEPRIAALIADARLASWPAVPGAGDPRDAGGR